MLEKNEKVGDVWVDEDGYEFVVTDIQYNVVISESVNPIEEEEE